MDILPKALNKMNYFAHYGKRVKSSWKQKRLIVLDYITLNKEGIVADITLNIVHIDTFLKALQFCGTSQNQIYFNQLQHGFKKQKHIMIQIYEKAFINLALYEHNF